jgi:hypothetical protein
VKRSFHLGSIGALAFFLASAHALAAETAALAPPKPKKAEQAALIGNKLPQCPDGQYVASMICKAAAPGYYLDYGMKYPAPCPDGMTSPAGAKAKTYCYKEK